MKVAVFGASGKVGRLVVQRLLEDGCEVVAFVHNTSPFTTTPSLQIIYGDIHKIEDVKRALKDSEAVVSALGSWGTKTKDVVSSGTAHIIQAMTSYQISRIVTLTGTDALTKNDRLGLAGRILHTAITLTPTRKILIDGEEHFRLLENSQLDWTVLRSPVMNTRGNPEQSTVSLTKPMPWATIHRQSVANTMVDLIASTEYYKKAPFIKRRKS